MTTYSIMFWEWFILSYLNSSNTFIGRRSSWTAIGDVWIIHIWFHCLVNVTLTLTLRLCHGLPICYFKIRWGRCWVNHHTRSGLMTIWRPSCCICPSCNVAVNSSLKLRQLINIISQYGILVWAKKLYTSSSILLVKRARW